MNYYSIALFLHIVGALAFFVMLSLEWVSIRHLQRATTTVQVHEWIRVPAELGRAGMVAMVILLAAGIYMMATVWGPVAWIIVSLVSLVPMSILGMTVSGRRMAAIKQAATAEHGKISSALHQLLHDPLLWISIQTRVSMALGIVFLMTVKPVLGGSLLTIGLATVLGFVSALPMLHREQVQEEPNT